MGLRRLIVVACLAHAAATSAGSWRSRIARIAGGDAGRRSLLPAGLERSMGPTATPLTDGALEFVTHGGPHDYANGVEWRMGATSAGRHFNAGASPPGLILTSPNHVWQPPSKRKSLGITWLGEKTWREGRYTLRSNIGTGRFGSVWSATRISSGPTRTFAIKLSNEAEVSISMGDEVVGSACKHYEKAPGTGVKVKKSQLAAFPAGSLPPIRLVTSLTFSDNMPTANGCA